MSGESFSEELKKAAGPQWDRIVKHRFTDELAAGTLELDVLKRYLIQDHRFLDAFVCLLSSMIVDARSLKDRIEACQFLALITSTENTYFERCFVELGIENEEERMKIPNSPVTDKFIQLMQDVVNKHDSSLGEKLAVLVVCEWSYLSWGQRVLTQTKRNDFKCYEWVDLHTGAYFESVIEYLKRLLDQEGILMETQEEKDACKKRFLETVQLEEEFFDHVYESSK